MQARIEKKINQNLLGDDGAVGFGRLLGWLFPPLCILKHTVCVLQVYHSLPRKMIFSLFLIAVVSIFYTAFHSLGSSYRERKCINSSGWGRCCKKSVFMLCINEIFLPSAIRQEVLSKLVFSKKDFFWIVLKKIDLVAHLLLRNSKSSSISDYVLYVFFASCSSQYVQIHWRPAFDLVRCLSMPL